MGACAARYRFQARNGRSESRTERPWAPADRLRGRRCTRCQPRLSLSRGEVVWFEVYVLNQTLLHCRLRVFEEAVVPVLYPLLAVLIWAANTIVSKAAAGVVDPAAIS